MTPVAATAAEAPAGNATATALQVTDQIGVAKTGAKAGSDNAEGKAAVLSIGDQAVLGTGGTQPSEGESKGALVDTGTAAPVRVEVAGWNASATGTKSSAKRSSKSSARAAGVEGPNGIKASVLSSSSQAEHTTEKSTALSTSDAADVAIGDTLRLVLLHSEVGSTGKGASYLVNLNGTKIGTDEDTTKVCNLEVPGVAALSCLTASGGVAEGITSGSAEVLGVKTALGLDPTAAFATSASSGLGSVQTPILTAVAETIAPAETPRVSTATTDAELPRTGTAAASLAASGLAALLSGSALRRFRRRR
jgi:LPXTG-motif cell wall-anchored protein